MTNPTPTSGAADLPEALYADAVKFAKEKASIAYVQRKCRCSYNKAERMLEQMVADGIIQTYNGRKDAALTSQAISAEPAGAGYAALQQKHNDYVETVGLMLDAIGYKEEYALQWPKEKASITFKRWFDEQLASHGQAPAQPAATWKPPGIGALMCVISSLRDTAHFSDEEGEVTNDLRALRDWASSVATPTPQAADTGAAWGAVVVPSDGQKDRLLAALERAAAAEFELRLLVDECDNDCIPGWEERMSERVASANRLLATTTTAQGAGITAGPLDSLALMKVVMQADEALSGRCIRGTTNWAAAIGKSVQRAVIAAAPQPAPPADSVLEDAARLEFLCDPTRLRMVECEKAGLWRVYQDEAPAEAAQHHWQAMTSLWHPTARSAIDAARKQGGSHD
ncbi:DNA translocase FtsK [Acidovorax radicis]|uniref:DNA translocase FtsK n=1 Tax=Acidovorax radicis TaxID=758826 RepID=UPI001CFA9E88|nr:DNA translocase FtsK [Acidovorax radicis]UCV00251.1 hypothetical protein KI609_05555 [Acidovorax radicis]